MSIEYLELVDYLAIAVEVTGLSVETITRVAKLDLADSAPHAPAAGFGNTEFYPDFIDKAAVLIVRLAKNHPLPDGNKRAAWVALRVFVEVNGWQWTTTPDIDDPNAPCSRSRPATGTRSEPLNGCAITCRAQKLNLADHTDGVSGRALGRRIASGARHRLRTKGLVRHRRATPGVRRLERRHAVSCFQRSQRQRGRCKGFEFGRLALWDAHRR